MNELDELDNSRPFKTAHFLPRLSSENETGTPKFNYTYKFKTFSGIQYWTRNFLLGTEICYITQIFPSNKTRNK